MRIRSTAGLVVRTEARLGACALVCIFVCACAGEAEPDGARGAEAPSRTSAPAPANAARPPAAPTPSAPLPAPRAPTPPMLGVRRDAGGLSIVSGDRAARWEPLGGRAVGFEAVPLAVDGSRWAVAAASSAGVELATIDEAGALAVLWRSDDDDRVLDVRLWDLDGDGVYELVAHRSRPPRFEIDIMIGGSTSRYVHRLEGTRFVPSARPRGGFPPLEPDWERLRRAVEGAVGGDCIEHRSTDVASSILERPAPPTGPRVIGTIGHAVDPRTLGQSTPASAAPAPPSSVEAGVVTARVCIASEPELRAVLALVELRDLRPNVLAIETIGRYRAGPLPEVCTQGRRLEEADVFVVNGSEDGRVRAIVPVWRDGDASFRARLFTYDGVTLVATAESAELECPVRTLPNGLPFAVEPGTEGRPPRLVVGE